MIHGASLSLFEKPAPAVPARRPRPYQLEVDAAVDRELLIHPATLVVSATGTGKSHMIAARVRKARRALIIAPQKLLVYQMQDELADLTGAHFEVEQGEYMATPFGRSHVIASAQSIMRKDRLERWARDAFDEIIVDEADCFRAAEMRKPLEYFTGRIVGFTATPHGMDDRIFKSTAFKFDLVDAIDAAWLVPLDCAPPIQCDVDLSKVEVSKETGDYVQEALDEAMAEVIAPVLRAALAECGDLSTLIFTPGVRTAHAAALALNQIRPDCAWAIDGKTPRPLREAQTDAWRCGERQFMANCRIFGRGFDFRALGCLIDAAPTKSKRVKIQRVGRVLRPSANVDACATVEERRAAIAASSKPRGRWIDLALNDAPGDLETPVTILGAAFTPKERKRASGLIAKGQRDPQEALLEARKQLATAAAKAAVKLKLGSYDPLSRRRRPKKPAVAKPLPTDPPNAGQLSRLAQFGIPVELATNHEAAQKLLRKEFFAKSKGWCVYKQREFLQKWCGGISGWAMPEAEGRRITEAWRANGWKRP